MKKSFLALLLAWACALSFGESLNLTDLGENGIPKGWKRYGQNGVCKVENGALRITDKDVKSEWGITRAMPIPGPGWYAFSFEAALPEGGNADGNVKGMLMTINGSDYQQRFVYFRDVRKGEFTRFRGIMEVKDPAIKNILLYIYSSYKENCDYLVRNADFSKIAKPAAPAAAPRAALSIPEPKPITKLKDLSLHTPLKDALIAPGDSPLLKQAAARLAAKFGAKIADPATLTLPLKNHVIALGSRVNNALIDRLYRRSFCYTDLVYPGRGGYELRSIHNPTGGGYNVILCGGSDEAGAVEAARLLEQESSTVGHLMKLKVPGFDKSKVNPYDSGHYYCSSGGYYGWNYLSGILALFYQTGDEFYAREFIRLAFPDARAKKDFQKFNAESIELPDDPLAGPYHYCANQMIQLWDLVEEHPAFTQEERLKVTNGFLRQWKHHIRMTRPVGARKTVGSRHSQWSSISIFVLGRYFNRDYPAPVWKDAMDRAVFEFSYANAPDNWIEGEGGIVSWFFSGSINPAAQFSALSDMTYHPDGALANALKFLQTQWDGSGKSEVLGTATRQGFYLVSELTGDGQYIWFADFLNPYPKGKFKLGASFSPTGKIAKRAPTELLNTWTAAPMKKAEYRVFGLKEPLEKCYLGLGWRDSLDETGDWVSFNCFNESYRTPFKLLSLNGLRLDGRLLLQGFGNYVQPTRGGTVPRAIPVVGQVYSYGSAGNTAFMTGGVPEHAYSAWERSLLLRKRDFVLLADTVTPRESGNDLTVNINFQTVSPLIKIAGEPAVGKLVFGQKTLIRDMKLSSKPERPVSWGPRNTLFQTQKKGDRAVITFPVQTRTECRPVLRLYDHNTRAGTVHIYLDGKLLRANVPHFTRRDELVTNDVSLGDLTLEPGNHTIEIEVASVHPEAASNYIGAGMLGLNRRKHVEDAVYCTGSAGEFVLRSGTDIALKRRIKSDPQRPVTTFTLFRQGVPERYAAAVTLDDRAALYLLPEPMLVFAGARAVGSGALVALETSGVAGTGVTAIGKSFRAAAPVMIDWRFGGTLTVSGKPGTACTVNGKNHILNKKGELVLAGLTPVDLAALRAELRHRPAVQKKPDQAALAAEKGKLAALTELPGIPAFITPHKDGFLAAVGTELILLDPQYRITARCKLDAAVQCAAAADGLFVAGCKDEKVVAFDKNGKKLWSFTSVLAPSIMATQKFYWFKSAYPGIYSLAIRDGKVFAGSACTMEVIHGRDGSLAARLAQPWGPCRQISIVDQADGSFNAVGLRNKATESVSMWAWNSRSGSNVLTYRYNVPGYRHFPSWGSLYRTQACVGKFSGSGGQELMADAQGMYTWLNLYQADGTPLRQVNLGPGKIICGWTAGDFTGDECLEAVIFTYTNELQAISGKCQPLWNVDLPFRGRLIAVDPVGRRIVVAGEKNELAVFSGKGKLLRTLKLPAGIGHLWCADGRIYVSCGRSISRVEL